MTCREKTCADCEPCGDSFVESHRFDSRGDEPRGLTGRPITNPASSEELPARSAADGRERASQTPAGIPLERAKLSDGAVKPLPRFGGRASLDESRVDANARKWESNCLAVHDAQQADPWLGLIVENYSDPYSRRIHRTFTRFRPSRCDPQSPDARPQRTDLCSPSIAAVGIAQRCRASASSGLSTYRIATTSRGGPAPRPLEGECRSRVVRCIAHRASRARCTADRRRVLRQRSSASVAVRYKTTPHRRST